MDARMESAPFEWVVEYNGHQYEPPVRTKRKVRSRKREFLGWGSRQLIEFLEAIGRDTGEQISQYDVTAIINDYVNKKNLLHPSRKKRIICDEWLLSIFGRKTISRIKIHDLLEPHFSENHGESDDDHLCSSEERENISETYGAENILSLERRTHQRNKASETTKSFFAAITPQNLKLVYLKKSLVKDLLNDPEAFESKLVGSFVRIKSDPNDYLQKNSHQLVQVTGLKKVSGMGSTNMEILLQVSSVVKDIRVDMLSDDNFTNEECNDLHQRIKDGLLKMPSVEEVQQKAQILHVDITKHWLAREIPLLQNLIDRANEKGWRRELDQYLEKKQLLETPDEQLRLLHDVPKVIAEEIEVEVAPKEIPCNLELGNGGSTRPIINGASEVPIHIISANGTASTLKSHNRYFAEFPSDAVEEEPSQFINDERQLSNKEGNESCGPMVEKQVIAYQVIDLSDDEENVEPSVGKLLPDDLLGSLSWHYLDPQGEIQGPFSLASLKRWSDADYFPPNFKVWRMGRSQDEAVLLKDVLHQVFPD